MIKDTKYNHTLIEKKWQDRWAKDELYQASDAASHQKKYILDMFPYPSGSTMHVGHLEGYVGTDILSRYFRMNGRNVFHPMGWDAFGLPAENYAIKTGINPDKSTHENIKTFKRQLEISGMSYDWSREIDTSSPEFYKWTQWLFIELYKKGLAYKKKSPVNWCPKDETVLANEQVVDGRCERCDTKVIQKELDQWFFKITDYADRLISGLDSIDWPEDVKIQQKNWIGRSEGRTIEFEIDGSEKKIKVFTTCPDTLNSATFLAVASKENKDSKEKMGKFTGEYAVNPLNGEKLPIWETNYVDSSYGTGAIMGVPAYDERDKEFAGKYHIDIVERPFTDKILGEKTIHYHLRDWLISRQRYWGCPIPMIYCQDCGWQPTLESYLPVLLPKDVDFLPHGESPIARSKTFQEGVKCPKCGKAARREVDTMDTYVDSSWYFIRFADPNNKKEFAGQENIKKWLPVDDYIGGGHVVQHLLFARFFWKVLFDAGLIDKSLGEEPFLKLRAPGWVLGTDGRKMSKRWGNVVTPDEIIPKFGADTLRVYEMFMGPFDLMKPWSITGVEGAYRFLGKVWRLFNEKPKEKPDSEVLYKLHQTIKKVTNDIENYKFNTAISSLMELTNTLIEHGADKETLKTLCLLIAPFAPHLSEEVWVEILGQPFSVHKATWPEYDNSLIVSDIVTVVVQVNGKIRETMDLDAKVVGNQSEVEKKARENEKISKWFSGSEIKKVIFVPGKLINFVI
ncbi:MAG: class I tRNA ligase family protein [Candidatus Microgenomates bacterium]|jgi:leucyl-tRNA synthetase